MTNTKNVLAFDFGASNGRAMLGRFDGERIFLDEVHRFSNDPVRITGTLYWDTPRQFFEITQGIRAAGKDFISIGIDTWGVDFGLFDKAGRLLENSVHYRDNRTDAMMDEVFGIISPEELYSRTGIQFQQFNSLFQLFHLAKYRPELLERADKLLFVPDMFGYFLTGNTVSEYSIASTAQMLNPHTADWDLPLMDKLGIPTRLLSDIVQPGSTLGMLQPSVCDELNTHSVPVISVAGHDTASAVIAVPETGTDHIYISSGTWSLMGVESDTPVVSETARKYNFTNEGGYNRKIRLLKNIMGMWLIQESRRHWNRNGQNLTYDAIDRAVEEAEPFRSIVDPDLPELFTPGNMPARIQDICRRTGQPVPETVGQVARCIYESLALKYRMVYDEITELTGKKHSCIHIVGGGLKNLMLNKLTANAVGIPVVTGPIEATALGNIAVQLIASGELKSLDEARTVIGRSFPDERTVYNTTDRTGWDDALERMRSIKF